MEGTEGDEMSPELQSQLAAIQEQLVQVLKEVRSLKKPTKRTVPEPDDSVRAAWAGANNLVKAFSAAFPDTYRLSGIVNKRCEMRAAKELLASGETIQSVIELAKHNASAQFDGYRSQSANLVLLQRNLCAIKVRRDGMIRPVSKTPYVPRQARADEQYEEWNGDDFKAPAPQRQSRL